MKRRQFGAMLATAAFSLGGVTGVAADASAQETEPLQVEDVSVNLGSVTASIGQATFAFEEGTMRFQVSDWSMEDASRSLSIGQAYVAADDVDAETYAAVRSGMVESVGNESLSPLLTALAEADVSPDAPVRLFVESVEADGQLVADQITATGTVDSVVPEGSQELVQDGASLSEAAALGPSEWSRLTIQRGDAEFTANDVVMQREDAAVAISSPGGSATVSGRSFDFEEMTTTLRPPETIPAAHVEFASQLRELASEGSLSLSAIRSAAADSGVTVANTSEAVQNARFDLSLANVSEGGETVVSNFETSGTLSELTQVLGQRV
ncbi:hypothetical protein [Halorussus salinisoli]|uniref:hypothetical protein n=1 Tax=Halorussus salinisoli TaxID=2558242 RepID=UPI0010C1C7E9|nr:hypothetical protein [Halorussus salinisoli]